MRYGIFADVSSYYRTAWIVLLLMMAGGAIADGWRGAASVLAGGLLSLINARWMAAGINLVTAKEGRQQVSSVMVGFIGRLVLIFGVLFAIIRTSFLSVVGFVGGFSVGILAALVEEFRHFVRKRP